MNDARTPGPWTAKDIPGAGWEIHAVVNIGKDLYATGIQPIYAIPLRPQLMVADDGTVTASISYESWRQFPSVNFTEMQSANARLIAAAPAVDIILRLLQLGLARFDHTTGEFCFDGLRYGVKDHDWNGLLAVIGWGKVRWALGQKVEGKTIG